MLSALADRMFKAFSPQCCSVEPSDLPVERLYFGGQHLNAALKLHTLYLATTRAGKSILARIALQDMLPLVANRPATCAQLFDPKTEFVSILDGMGLLDYTVIVNAYDTRSHGWRTYLDCPDDQTSQVLAEQIVPKETSKNGGESHFTITVRSLVKAECSAFNRKGVKWYLRDLLLALSNPRALEYLLSLYYDTRVTLHLALHQREETAQDVFSSINNLFNRYGDIAALWHHAISEGKGFSVSEWINSNQILLLPGADAEGDPLNTMTELIFDRASDAILALPEAVTMKHPRRVFTIVDEVRQAGKFRKLKPLLFKSAGRGNRVQINAQGVEGMRDAFGEQGAEEIFSLCANKALGRAGSDVTAEWMSRQIHKQIVREAEISRNQGKDAQTTSTTWRRIERSLVQSIRFLNLRTPETDDGIEGYFIAPELRRRGRSVFWNFIPSKRLFTGPNKLLWDRGEAPDFIKRPAHQQQLTPWDDADLQRLELPASVMSGFGDARGFRSVSRKAFA